ncbi:Aspyridones efflux protein [Lachnellula willkommii]|uniref:Aspyridones efflux protein n=1 Tax=Lachnellula willkommii TaxID=215461 RepID=A0A559M5D6_9HELO|nr:Aspyridones efflux protein [Lachnellula willkommii]
MADLDGSKTHAGEIVHVEMVDDLKDIGHHTAAIPNSRDPVVSSYPEGGLRGWMAVAGAFCVMFTTSGFYYQVFLCQGLLIGLSTGFLSQPTMSVLSHYFEKRRAFVMGIATSGASLGGVVYPMLLNNLFTQYGFAWGVRIANVSKAGFMIFALLIFSNFAMTTRLPTRHRGRATVHAASSGDLINAPENIPKINWKTFLNPAYVISIIGMAFIMVGATFPFSYLQVFAEANHVIDENFAFYVLSIMMSGSVFGASFWAYVADHHGSLSVVVFAIFICGGLQWALLGANTRVAVAMIGVIYGFFSSADQALMTPVFATLSLNVTELGQRMGYGYFLIGIGSLVPQSPAPFSVQIKCGEKPFSSAR